VTVLSLVADQPQVVERLEMVSGRSLAAAVRAAGHEVRAGVEDRRPGRGDTRDQVERDGEDYKA
jgi:hypothetical protein